MKLSALRLHNVKRFSGRGVAIEGIRDGVNVLSAANEFGKSTCFEALHALFFQAYSGTPKAVQLLRPYSGGSPLIEADISVADRSYRLSKQFYAGKSASVTDLGSGRLIAQADEAEAFISDLVRGGTEGPAGLLWVRQGITGIENRPQTEKDDERRAREDVLTSVQGEVEVLTGGRRMLEVTMACADELALLVTATGRPKTGGPYAAAVEERDALAAAERRLEADVTDLRMSLDARRTIRNRLEELENPDENATLKAAAKEAEKALAAARAHREQLRTAEAEADLARNRFGAVRSELDAHRKAVALAGELRSQQAVATAQRDEALIHQARIAAEAAAKDVSVDTAEQAEKEARDLLTRLERAMRAKDASERLTDLSKRLEEAETARTNVEGSEAAFRVLGLPDKVVRDLETLETELAGLRAAHIARLPTFRLDYRDGGSPAVCVDGVPVVGGEEHPVSGSVALEFAGIGTLTVKSPRHRDGEEKLSQAEERRRALLVSLGVETLSEARDRQARAKTETAKIELERQRLNLLAPKGIAALREDISRLQAEAVGELELKGDPDRARAALGAAGQYLADARNAARETRPVLDQAARAVVECEKSLTAIEHQLAGVDAALGPEGVRSEREAALAEQFVSLEAVLATAETRLAALRSTVPDLANAEAIVNRRRSVIDVAANETARLREQLADLSGHIRTRTDDAVEETWQETVEARQAADARVRRFETEIAVLTRLRNALDTARSSARDLYLKPVMSELRPLMGLLFEDASVVFDENTLLPVSVLRNGQDEKVERLSGGMREQLSVLTRLAFARLLARNGRPAPVILDDALVYSDDDRIERMFDALHRQSAEQQIIIFSCRQRAFTRLGGHSLQMIDWKPDRA